MKRSYIKRRFSPNKYRRTDRYKLIIRCESLLKKILLKERGSKCEWCGGNKMQQMAHILPKGIYPRLRFYRKNILLLCFYCHLVKWHKHPLEASKFIEGYKGQDYQQKLLLADKTAPKITMFFLKSLEVVFKRELQEI